MSKKVFTGKTLEECIRLASVELDIPEENLQYETLEDKKGFFVKKASISVEIKKTETDNKNGSIRIENGIIVVENPKEGGKPSAIKPPKGFKIIVNGEELTKRTEVFEDSEIQVVFKETTAERKMNINISPNQMEAYLSIKYVPQNIYILEDKEEARELEPRVILKEQKYPEPFSTEEVYELLAQNGIQFGIIKSNVEQIPMLKEVDNMLIAKGTEPIEGLDDKIIVNFEADYKKKKLVADKEGRIDYKSIGRVHAIQVGYVLATKEDGREGKEGIDIKGSVKKPKLRKKYVLKVGEGCKLNDDNTAVATIEGKPSRKGEIFSVHQVHVVENDVDIKTGNIDFIGDVIVNGNIKEGMQVNAGHDLIVYKNIESAKANSTGDLVVHGNVINSNLNAGGDNISKLNKIKNLDSLYTHLNELINTVKHIKQFNLLGQGVRDGEIIKVLIENKFKPITLNCNEFIKLVAKGDVGDERILSSLLSQKLMGFAPLSLRDVSEIEYVREFTGKVKEMLKGLVEMPVEVDISYCQDSAIKSSGNIFITGKGEYVSKIIAHESVIFTSPGSLARGGVIEAKNEIKCKKVGSEGGVSTKLIVEASGNIWADVAYQNTCFVVGNKEYVLEIASKEVHAYLNNEGEITVDKFVL